MTSRHLSVLPAAPFARHTGRHRRRWFTLPASKTDQAVVVDDFSRARTPALVPLSSGEPTPYRHPYDSPKDAA